jgi:hypothetical protein
MAKISLKKEPALLDMLEQFCADYFFDTGEVITGINIATGIHMSSEDPSYEIEGEFETESGEDFMIFGK